MVKVVSGCGATYSCSCGCHSAESHSESSDIFGCHYVLLPDLDMYSSLQSRKAPALSSWLPSFGTSAILSCRTTRVFVCLFASTVKSCKHVVLVVLIQVSGM